MIFGRCLSMLSLGRWCGLALGVDLRALVCRRTSSVLGRRGCMSLRGRVAGLGRRGPWMRPWWRMWCGWIVGVLRVEVALSCCVILGDQFWFGEVVVEGIEPRSGSISICMPAMLLTVIVRQGGKSTTWEIFGFLVCVMQEISNHLWIWEGETTRDGNLVLRKFALLTVLNPRAAMKEILSSITSQGMVGDERRTGGCSWRVVRTFSRFVCRSENRIRSMGLLGRIYVSQKVVVSYNQRRADLTWGIGSMYMNSHRITSFLGIRA